MAPILLVCTFIWIYLCVSVDIAVFCLNTCCEWRKWWTGGLQVWQTQEWGGVQRFLKSGTGWKHRKFCIRMNNHKECRYCRRDIFWWWQGWSIFSYCRDLFHGGQTVVLAGCYGGWRPKSCEILYHLNWLKICGWRFGRAIGVLDIEKKSVFPFADFFWSEQKV